MAKYKIVFDKPNCIGCSACTSVCDNWEMKDDGKSYPKKTDLDDNDFKKNLEAAQTCPVNVIHIVESATKKKVI